MSKLAGNGTPTRNTPAAMGDIYIDKDTGKKYECTFSYRDITDKKFDTQWKDISGNDLEIESEKNPSGEILENNSSELVTNTVEQTGKYEKKYDNRKHTDYSSYSKKKH